MKLKNLLITVLAILVVMLAGCQGTSAGLSANAGADTPTEAENQPIQELEGADEVSQPTPTLAAGPVDDAEEVTDELGGVTVGFTDSGDPFKGDPNAPVVIEEFSSYQCPYCVRYFNETYGQILDAYVNTGQALYIFRDFPLAGKHLSVPSAEAASCAGELGGADAFWGMHDLLFADQATWSGGDAEDGFKQFAQALGLDVNAFTECMASDHQEAAIQADAAEGSQRGVRGTPTFFVNGQPLVGAQPFAAFAQAIDQALGGQAQTGAETPPEERTPYPTPTPATIAPVEESRVLGDPDAPVTIVEFSDYQCPFCARYFTETWPQLKANFIETGRVKYIFKDFPLTSIHPQAVKAGEAARCAGEQNAYWDMHDLLYTGQAAWSGNAGAAELFKDYAAELGLDAGAFDTCLDSGRWEEAVMGDLNEGLSLGVTGTPAFFIDGYPIRGAQPYELFEYAIQLAEQGILGNAYEPQQ